MSDRIKFWSKVTQKGECLVWLGSRTPSGYGRLRVGKKLVRAHRYAWYLETGFWPPTSLECCHTCDNPPCVRKDHLFLATHRGNMEDREAKGRGVMPPVRRGWEDENALLSEEAVMDIRTTPKKYGAFTRLAKKYGVHRVTVHNVWYGKTYRTSTVRNP